MFEISFVFLCRKILRLDGAMNQQMKLTIRPKIESYVKRAEEIKDILKNGGPKKKAVADSANGRGNSKDKGGDDDDGDPDKKRMMQKFEGAIVTDPNVTFADVVGLEQAKEALKEAVILPVKFPQLFQGKRKPWAGILLYGVRKFDKFQSIRIVLRLILFFFSIFSLRVLENHI